MDAPGVAGKHGDPAPVGRRRRWQAKKRRGAPAGSGLVPEPGSAVVGEARAPSSPGDLLRPRRFIDRSERIARAEDELRWALFVSVVGDTTALSVDVLAAELAHRHELPASSLVFHRLGPADLLLVLPDEASAVSVFNEGCPLQFLPFMLHFRRWSCFAKATRVILPHLVNVEVRGLPAHVWELETAEHPAPALMSPISDLAALVILPSSGEVSAIPELRVDIFCMEDKVDVVNATWRI